MQNLYLDNGSTSFPKAPGVLKAVADLIENGCYNINRGGYEGAYAIADSVLSARERLCELFNAPKAKNVIFTPSVTYSLNFLIKGLAKPNMHFIISSMEHNAIMRPLAQLLNCAVSFTAVECAIDGSIEPNKIESAINSQTSAVIITHASNVCGTIMPLEEIGAICQKHGIYFIVDCAQTAGCVPIDIKKANISALAFTGHKGLLAMQGIGGFIISDELSNKVSPIISGGTGSRSHSEDQPNELPDKFESGTQNLPGIISLNASLEYIAQRGIDSISKHELQLAKHFLDNLDRNLLHIKGIDKADRKLRTAAISIDFLKIDNAQAAYLLAEEYGIMTRCGLHCAPRAHKTLGTFPKGTVRFTFGCFNKLEDASYAADAVNKIADCSNPI